MGKSIACLLWEFLKFVFWTAVCVALALALVVLLKA